jgi:hypothetical protein
MKKECMDLVMDVQEILEKELTAELTKIKEAGRFAPGQSSTLKDAVKLMREFKELEMSETNPYEFSGRQMRNPTNGQYMRGFNTYGYPMNRSGHSTRDRMIACLEDLMGEVKNEYEAQMVSDVIRYVQNSER